MSIDDFNVAASNTPAMGSSSALLLWCLLQLAPSNSSDAESTKSDVDECVQGMVKMESRMSDDPRPIPVESDGTEVRRRKKRFVAVPSSPNTYVEELHERCTKNLSDSAIEKLVRADKARSTRQPRDNEEPAHQLLTVVWGLFGKNSAEWRKKKNVQADELVLRLQNGRDYQIEGSLTDVSRRAALIYSHYWKGNQSRQDFYTRFRLETLPPSQAEHNVANYPFCGVYAALYTLPRVKFQLPMKRGSNDPIKSFAERFPREAFNWSRVTLARGSKTNYFQSASVGNVFRFGCYTSFTTRFQTAINFASPHPGMSNPSPIFIFIYESRKPKSFARPIAKLSINPHQEEFLVDPMTKFEIVDIFDGIRVKDAAGKGIESRFIIIKPRSS